MKNLLLDNAQDIFLAHDQMLFAVNIYFRSSVLAEKHAIVDFDIEWDDLTVVIQLALPDSDNLSLLWFFFRGIGNNESPLVFPLLQSAEL